MACTWPGLGRHRGGCFPGRKIECQGRARAGLAVDAQRAARLLDEAVHRAQAEAGAAPRRLGGEEGLERALLHLLALMPTPLSAIEIATKPSSF